mgnify:CR=1 FL=1
MKDQPDTVSSLMTITGFTSVVTIIVSSIVFIDDGFGFHGCIGLLTIVVALLLLRLSLNRL